MRLELGTFLVKDVEFSNRTQLNNGILSINQKELKKLIANDPNIEGMFIDIARPGEETRIIHIIDIVEPRFKVSGGSVFPGILGPPHTAGQGRTHRLAGIAVVECSEPVAGEPTYWREAIIDMSGNGALYSPFSKMINLVLTFKPAPLLIAEINEVRSNGLIGSRKAEEYNASVRLSGIKVSNYLAQITNGIKPDRLSTYELRPVDSSLPRVAFAHRLFYSTLDGESTVNHLATFIHPNELMDGALANAYNSPAAIRDFTYFELNNPIVSELYNRHGEELNFVGVILYNSAMPQHVAQERVAKYADSLTEQLTAQGVLLPGGSQAYHGAVLMLLCQKLERKGIKTVILSTEMSLSPGDSGLTHYIPEAVATVSVGNLEEKILLSPIKKVIGGGRILESNEDAIALANTNIRLLCGATNRLGAGEVFCKDR